MPSLGGSLLTFCTAASPSSPSFAFVFLFLGSLYAAHLIAFFLSTLSTFVVPTVATTSSFVHPSAPLSDRVRRISEQTKHRFGSLFFLDFRYRVIQVVFDILCRSVVYGVLSIEASDIRLNNWTSCRMSYSMLAGCFARYIAGYFTGIFAECLAGYHAGCHAEHHSEHHAECLAGYHAGCLDGHHSGCLAACFAKCRAG